jgi:hypothetical protein
MPTLKGLGHQIEFPFGDINVDLGLNKGSVQLK